MAPKRTFVLGSVFVLTAILAFGSMHASAMSRHSGDFWTYDVTADMSGLMSGVSVTGSITYEFAGQDTIMIEGASYEVNVMRVHGDIAGSMDFLGFEAEAAIGGYVYETTDGWAIVRADIHNWLNISMGTGSFSIVTRSELQVAAVFSPPLLSEFDPETKGPGDSWSETVTVDTTTTEWLNGTVVDGPDSDSSTMTYSLSVASTMMSATTPAGTFETLQVTATGDDGTRVVYWWSDLAGNFVKAEAYEEGSTQPLVTATLADYNRGGGLSTTLIIAAGVGVLLLAIVVLLVVLLLRSRPGPPAPYPPVTPQPPPPPPGR